MKLREKTNILDLEKQLTPFINSLYEIYKCLNISKENFNNLINKGIEIQINNDSSDEKVSINSIKNSIINQFNKYIIHQLSLSKVNMNILNNIVQNKIIDGNYSPKTLQDISSFFKFIEFVPSPDLLYKLISSNSLFANLIQKEIEPVLDIIDKKSINELFNDEFIIVCVKLYCEKNGIKYFDDEEIDIDLKISTNDNISSSYLTYVGEIKRYPILSRNEEQQLFKSYRTGNLSSRKKIIECNLRLVLSIARKYYAPSLDILDIVQYGNIGLIKAVEKYDVSKGYAFSTYATYYIKQEIRKSIREKTRNIKLPDYLVSKMYKYKSYVGTTDELLNKNSDLSKDIIDSWSVVKNDTLSLNTPAFHDGEEKELLDFVEDKGINIEDSIEHKMLIRDINKIINVAGLSEKEMFIIKARFGFNIDDKILSRNKIGKYFGVTYESIRHSELRALRKLRKASQNCGLYTYMGNPEESLLTLKRETQRIFHNSKDDEEIDLIGLNNNSETSDTIINNNIDDNDICHNPIYLKIIEDLKVVAFTQLSQYFNEDEKALISVQSGYIEGCSLSMSALCHVLKISKAEALKIMKNIITKYSNNIISIKNISDEDNKNIKELMYKLNNSLKNC